ncbi:MAG TPA: MBL fold metallo-hydrolase [Candidatus Binataceae bacterium]|jgi:L-ascorbate metabolism protein UlaG (beta-lactamase superfamily)|nr:MBL fold metallo-hydrolase [Candidatus Binataceae bacterium]
MATSLSSLTGVRPTDPCRSDKAPAAPGGRLCISPAVSVEFLYRDFELKIPPRVDCIMMFAGPHLEQILAAYEEAVRLFSEIRDPAELLKRLQASADVQKVYESGVSDGKVSIVMRDAMFRQPGQLERLEFKLRILAGKKRTFFYPVPLARFGALGNLFPLLLGHYDESAIEARLRARLASDDAQWSLELLAFLKSEGCLAPTLASDEPPPPPSWTARPGVTLLSHSSLLVQSERSAVLIDPVVWQAMGHAQRTFDILRTPLGAICCSHSHWDHCHFQTLLWLDKDVPILIPQVREPSVLNPPMADAVRRLGFTDVREVKEWVPVRIDDIEIIPIPFRGEQDELDFEMDHYTYVVRTAGLSLYGGVDCYRSTNGDMRPVVERVGQTYRPDVALLPVSKWICHYKTGGVNAFCRYLDQEMLEQSFQYTAGPEDAADWAVLLGAPTVVPYATFTFVRGKVPPEVAQFAEELRRRGIGQRFYPMRPLDSLAVTYLGDGLRARSRRWRLVAWSRGVGGLYRLGRRAGVGRAYRNLCRKLHL